MSSLLLGEGAIFHARTLDAQNKFNYPTFFLYFDVAKEHELHSQLKKQFGRLISFQSKNYLKGESRPLLESVKEFLKKEVNVEPDEIWLQTMPKMFGFVFNPVSFWVCKANQKNIGVLCEVNNTFGERHFYWLGPSSSQEPLGWQKTTKAFHVSPFQPLQGYYRFRFQFEEAHNNVEINYHDNDDKLRLATWIKGDLLPLSSRSLWHLLSRYGWMTVMVVIRIHYQALKLFCKKVRFFKKPTPPTRRLSL